MIGMTAVPLDKKNEENNKCVVSKSTDDSTDQNLTDDSTAVLTAEQTSAQKITFNFSNTELKVFARFVAKLCENFLIGEDLLKGNINIKSQVKLNLTEVKDLLKAVLYSKGLDFIENDICMEVIQHSDSITKVYRLNYLKSSDLATSLTQMFRMSFRVGNQPVNIQITSIDEANALMVLAPKAQQLEIEKTIKKMDVRIRQVMLNIMVLEVSKISAFGFGVDVVFNDKGDGNGNTGGLISGTGGNKATSSMTFTTDSISSAGGVTYSKGNWTINAQGVDKNTRRKILTQPRVMAANNQKAEIRLGEKKPYVTTKVSFAGGSTSSGNNASTSSEIKTDDVGLNLEITPRINNVKDVTLDLKLEITSFINSLKVISGKADKTNNVDNTNDVPQIGHRIINNSSNVKSGEVLVIGGMLKNQKTVITTAPPVLGDIPWLGWMFAKSSEATEQIELMVFISPTIIYNSEEGDALTIAETDNIRNYDITTKGTIDQMLTGKKGLSDNVFNIFDYFSNGKYRSEQDFIAQPGSL
jgi:general secretion pathway protein D